MKLPVSFLILLLSMTVANLYGHQPPDLAGDENQVDINAVEVVGYSQPHFRWETPSSVGIIADSDLEIQSPVNFVPAFSTVPGVKLEERSPGSYRLSIRGSLVRSPYGVRNVKVYYNGFSLSDAGGNTYLNALNVADVSSIEIVKGPDGSRYGANSGGVVFLNSFTPGRAVSAGVYGGSYGLFGQSVNIGHPFCNHTFNISESYQRSDGFRANTKNSRLFVQLCDNWNYNRNGELFINGFVSRLDYLTPGGLTEEQYKEDPKQARPASVTMPGSVEQKTGIDQKMYFAGIRNTCKFGPFEHVLSLWYHHVDFVYPFITNYETRKEDNSGLRTYLAFEKVSLSGELKTNIDFGFEGQWLVTDIYNYDNHAGEKGQVQAYDNILNRQSLLFAGAKIKYRDRLTVQAALSLNFNGYHFRDTVNFSHNFKTVLMPHFAVNYRVNEPLDLRLTLSRGFSPPTTAEVRPSDNKIYRDLQPEHGWNVEAGVRLNLLKGRLAVDASAYHYLLKDGIVSQVDSTANTHFVNAGKIRQTGFELYSSFVVLPYRADSFVREIKWNTSFTYSAFKFLEYLKNGEDFSGNRVPGVPRTSILNNLHLAMPRGLSIFVQHTYSGRIALNDANNIFASAYNIVYARLGWNEIIRGKIRMTIYIAADNLLDEKYSLGHDINAAGGRYFNAAPGRNYICGVKIGF